MDAWMERTELLLGKEKLNLIKKSNILIVGLGGVGGYAAEQLVRAGVTNLTVVDGDKVSESNINRQLPASHKTIGMEKAELIKARFLEINPNLKLTVIPKYIEDSKMQSLILQSNFNYVIDAIDTIAPKVELIKACVENKIPLVSSMGAGGRLDPTKIEITDISKSYNDKFAFNIRRRLHKYGIFKGFKVVFSSELVNKNAIKLVQERNKKSTVGTISFLPAAFGIYCASVVLNDIVKEA